MSTNGNGNVVATLSDDLIERAKAIASRSDELLQLLEDARQRLAEPGDKPAPRRRFKSEPAARPTKKASKGEVSEGLRIVTTQMSVSGAGREEITARLRDEFGIADPEPILKSIGL
jgi:hypothetical protein